MARPAPILACVMVMVPTNKLIIGWARAAPSVTAKAVLKTMEGVNWQAALAEEAETVSQALMGTVLLPGVRSLGSQCRSLIAVPPRKKADPAVCPLVFV